MSKNESPGEQTVVLGIRRIDSFGAEHILSKPRSGKHVLTKLSSKSEDSLDSGVYSRQKSCDSMDSLDSTDFNGDGNSQAYNVGLSPSDELLPPLPTQQYDDYFNEIFDIRQSIIVSGSEDEKKPVSRTDSGDDDDHEAHWLRLAGLSDLVVSSNSSPQSEHAGGKMMSSRMSTDSLSSMTVLSTLTRPQREAVLRRITSFNRAQKSKRKPKPAITAIFPDADVKSPRKKTPPPIPPHKPHKPAKNEDKSSSLPRGMTGFVGDSPGYTARRYSESTRSDGNLSPTSAPKLDYISKHRKNVESIVATTGTGAENKTGSNRLPASELSSSESLTSGRLIPPPNSLTSKSLPDLSYQDFEGGAPLLKVVDCDPVKCEDKELESDPASEDKKSGTFLKHHHSFSPRRSFPIVTPTLKQKQQKLKFSFRNLGNKKKLHKTVTSPVKVPQRSETLLVNTNRNLTVSPFHKVKEMTLRSTPKRSGSYKLKPGQFAPSSRTLKRSRSLKTKRTKDVSLVSFRRSMPSPVLQQKWNTSIETLSISHRPSSGKRNSWQGREELSLQFNDGGRLSKPAEQLSYSKTEDKESLPNFSLVKDRLGTTQISDLSSPDIRKVQSLALIELAALFDLRNVEFKRKKIGKLKFKDSGVFGIPLSNLLENDQKRTHSSVRVPLVLIAILDFLSSRALKDEGILRKSGSAARVKLLKQDMDLRFGGSTVSELPPIEESKAWNEAHPNDLATLLKQFLRELPDPLLSNDYIDAFHSCEQITDRKEQLQALNLLIILLNEAHRDSLKLLLKFLTMVVSNEQWNKMSLNNVAMITAPNLFMSRKQSKTTSQDIKHAAGTSNIVRMLIKYHKLLWTVPAFMLTQVRNMNTAEISTKKNSQKEKHKLKFFPGKKDIRKQNVIQENQQPFHHDTPKGVIKIQAPNMVMTSMAVQLDIELTAGSIIAKFQKQCEKMRHKGRNTEHVELIDNNTHALHEVGGNIGERCLDPSTNMSALLRINPDASWFIRPRVH